jgi:hypothetical protein
MVPDGATRAHGNGFTVCCPQCGSFLDAVRVNPATGRRGRKCVECLEWHPIVLGARMRDLGPPAPPAQ